MAQDRSLQGKTMSESSKYLLGGVGLLAAQGLFVALFGWPTRIQYPMAQSIGLFVIALSCIGYGLFLRLTEGDQ